ncbi:MAG: CHAP domain-containing protein [Saccharofermentans sp.]|nr:CHAP domain-containing protein [Saccharofermentans sp.]
MSQINKVEREKDIKQVSRLDDLKPATEKTITKVQNKPTVKVEQIETVIDDTSAATFKAAQITSIAAIRHARTISEESDKTEDQEAIDKLEASGRTAISNATNAALDTKESLRRQIRKKRSDIKNTKDIKTGTRTISKADRTLKTANDASRLAVKSTIEASRQAAIVSQKVATAKKAERLSKKAAESVKKIVQGIINAIKRLCAALEAASVPIMLILVLAAAIGALVASAFGIFFTGDVSGEGTKTLQEVVLEINQGYNNYIEEIKKTITHDDLTIEGYCAPWPDIISVYAVYMTTKSDNPTDVVHMTEEHEKLLYDLFWTMNYVSYTTEEITVTEKVPDLDKDGNQKKDADGNLLYIEQEKTSVTLHITVDHVSAQQEAEALYFNAEQMAELNELLDPRNASLWLELLRGIGLGSSELVNLALSQLGNEGGEKFWRWAGLDERCEWCALFVSWCGDQTGLRASGQIPFFSFVSDGVDWFKSKGKWIDGSEINSSNYNKRIYPGMIIFFDWEPDGKPNHVGIVTKVVDGYIYTVEGNSGDAVREKSYSADSKYVFGFGIIG